MDGQQNFKVVTGVSYVYVVFHVSFLFRLFYEQFLPRYPIKRSFSLKNEFLF